MAEDRDSSDTGDRAGEQQKTFTKNKNNAKMNVTGEQIENLIRGVIAGAAGGAGGAAGSISAASLVGPMGPCILGRDRLKRPKKWTDWLREAENKMRFGGITENDRKWDFLRSCAGGS